MMPLYMTIILALIHLAWCTKWLNSVISCRWTQLITNVTQGEAHGHYFYFPYPDTTYICAILNKLQVHWVGIQTKLLK